MAVPVVIRMRSATGASMLPPIHAGAAVGQCRIGSSVATAAGERTCTAPTFKGCISEPSSDGEAASPGCWG